jgi:hypothetical protein
MKNIMSHMIKFSVISLCVLLIAATAHAATDELPMEQNSMEVNCHLTVQFPTLPEAPSFTANAFHTTFVYWLGKGNAMVRGEDFPELVYSTNHVPGKMHALTVKIEGMAGTTATINWSSYPKVTMEPVDLRVRAYNKVASELDPGDEPIVDIILPALSFSTEEVSYAGYSTSGYIDAETLEAQVVTMAVLPKADYPAYEKWLEGEPVLIELRIQIPNPFAEK